MPVPTEPNRPYFREGDEDIPVGLVHEYPHRRAIRGRPQNLPPNERWQRLNNIYLRQITQSFEDIQSHLTAAEQSRFHNSLLTTSNFLSEIITAVRIRQEQ